MMYVKHILIVISYVLFLLKYYHYQYEINDTVAMFVIL